MGDITRRNKVFAALVSTGAALFALSLSAQESPRIFEAAFEYDFNSAYVWNNAVQNDQMVMQPCVWADVTCFEPFWFGLFVWQNYNLTDRTSVLYRYGLSENDYGAFAGATLWSTEDNAYAVWTEVTHDWFTYPGVRESLSCYSPDTRDLKAKVRFDNPFLSIYGAVTWLYRSVGLAQQGFLYEAGLNKEVEVVKALTAGADWNVTFGDRAALSNLYGEGGNAGIGGTTVKFYLVWHLTEAISLGSTIAYTGVLNTTSREALSECAGYWGDGSRDAYPRDLLWGGINLKVKY